MVNSPDSPGSDPKPLSYSLGDPSRVIGEVDDPDRARETKIRDLGSEIHGIQAALQELSEMLRGGLEPDQVRQRMVELLNAALSAQADHFEITGNTGPSPLPESLDDNPDA